MPSDILDPSALLSLIPTFLPPSSKVLKTSHDAIAVLVHSSFSALGFRLTSVDDASSIVTLGSVLPIEWNRNGPGHYTFKYKHDQSSLEYVVKISKMGTRTLINAIAVESDKVASLDFSTSNFVSDSFYPCDLNAPDAPPLVHGFISSYRVTDLVALLKPKIIQKLIPGLQKDGYAETDTPLAEESNAPSSSQNPPLARPQPQGPPSAPFPYASQQSLVLTNPLQIGSRDLDPFPRNPFSPPSLFPDANGGDGMFVGPDHPIFGLGRDRNGRFPVQRPWGGDGFLSPMGAPPGARFDPVGPSFSPDRSGQGPMSGRSFPRRSNLGDPDNDEFMPPGVGDSMFS